jgi:hypothetical protein
MIEDKRVGSMVDALRYTEAFLEDIVSEPVPSPTGLPQEIVVLALVRTWKLLPGIALLIENGLALAAEPAIRSLFELAFNVGWMGTDAARAQGLKNRGLRNGRVWRNDMVRLEPEMFPSETMGRFDEWLRPNDREESPVPSLEQRAAQSWMKAERYGVEGLCRGYAFGYRRLSGAAHGDYWHLAGFADREEVLVFLDARDAVTAAMLVIMLGAEVVGMTPRVEGFVLELRQTLESLGMDKAPPVRG